MKKVKKKKKSNKILLIIFTIILIIGIVLFIPNIKKYLKPTKEKEITKEELTNNILNNINDELITDEFLYWISDNYKINTLKRLDEYLKNNTYDSKIWHEITGNSYIVLNDLYTKKYDNINNVKVIDKQGDTTISFVGDVSLADNWYIMPKYDERKKGVYGILSEDTIKVMTESDIMVANSEFTISDRGEKMPGKYYTFRGSPKRIPIYDEMGVDLLTLANNHVYDFGETAFNDMIDSLNEYKMPYIGAGKNID